MNGREYWRRMQHTELGTDWRMQLACRHVDSGKRRMPIEFDSTTRSLAEYLQLKVHGDAMSEVADGRFPHIALAESAWAQPELRAALQMLVLADVAMIEICEQLDLEIDVLTTIEQIRFDVRSMLAASHWVVHHVIASEADTGRDDLAARLRMSYFGGPYAAKALIEARSNLPLDSARQLADSAVLLHAKFLQAVEMPLTTDLSIEFIRLTTELRRDEQRIQLEREKLAFRVKRWTQRCELNQARKERDGNASVVNETVGAASPDARTSVDAT